MHLYKLRHFWNPLPPVMPLNSFSSFKIYFLNCNNSFLRDKSTLYDATSILSPQPYEKCPLSNLSTQPCLFSSPNFAPKVPPRYVSMYVFRLFRLSRQLGCTSGNLVK